VRVTSENKVRFMLIDTGSIYKGIDSPVLTAGWHHIVSVWDGVSVKIYVDGVDDSQTAIKNGTVIIITTTTNTKVGLDTTSAAHYFNGPIDEVRIWDKSLQPEDMLNPEILVEKSSPESAHVDDIIIYTMTNTGYIPLSAVTVSDDLAGDAVYVRGDDGNNFLEVGEIWIFTVNYVVTFNDPEWLINIATAIGTDELDVTVGDEDPLDHRYHGCQNHRLLEDSSRHLVRFP